MAHFDEGSAECLIFTFKEGLLSKMAHDLKLRVGRLALDVDGSSVRAELDASSLHVVSAMKGGAEHPSALSPEDRRKIERRIVEEVLRPRLYPSVCFESRSVERSEDGARVEGELTLCGICRPWTLDARRRGGDWVVQSILHQPDWGIAPFRAALGTLRVKADVQVRLRVPSGEPPVSPRRS